MRCCSERTSGLHVIYSPLFRQTNDYTLHQCGENRIMNDFIRSKIQKQIVLARDLTTIQINRNYTKPKIKIYFFHSTWRNSYFIKLLYRYLCLFDSFILSCKIFVAQKNALVASFKRNIFSETKLKELMIKIHMFLRRGKMTERRD